MLIQGEALLEITPFVPHYSKVSVKDKSPPICLQFRPQKKGDYTVCASFKRTQPDEDNCDESEKKPKKMLLNSFYDSGSDFLYLSIISKKGCTLSLRVTFPILKQSKNPL